MSNDTVRCSTVWWHIQRKVDWECLHAQQLQNSGIFGILVPKLDSRSFWLKATEEMGC